MINRFLEQLENINIALEAIEQQLKDMLLEVGNNSEINAIISIHADLSHLKKNIELTIEVLSKPIKCPICSIQLNENEYKTHLEVHKVIREKGY